MPPTFSIAKVFSFEAAHRFAAPYEGKCAHLHGHSWRVEVTILSRELDANSMVRDFADLSPLRDWINERLDHATLVSAQDRDLLAWLETNAQKHFITPSNPSSELIAKLIFDRARELGFAPAYVEVAETCTCKAGYGEFTPATR